MQQKQDGQNYAPVGIARAVCPKGRFKVGIIGLDHGHIYGMCNGLKEAGATLVKAYDKDAGKLKFFAERYGLKTADSPWEIYEDGSIDMIASAAIPDERGLVAKTALLHGKHCFMDKPSVINAAELLELESLCKKSKLKFFTYFSERLHVEAAVFAERLINDGAIGRVIQVTGFGPHRLSENSRPHWFFDKNKYGGIITDLGCHQIEQILFFTKARNAQVSLSRTGNYCHHRYPLFEDFGEVSLLCDNGSTGYFRVDWFTPDGLKAWGDGRTFILGENGYIELRKYIDIAKNAEGDHVYWANATGEHYRCVSGQTGFPFFGKMILDCMQGTSNSMSQDYIFKVMALAIKAQSLAAHLGENFNG